MNIQYWSWTGHFKSIKTVSFTLCILPQFFFNALMYFYLFLPVPIASWIACFIFGGYFLIKLFRVLSTWLRRWNVLKAIFICISFLSVYHKYTRHWILNHMCYSCKGLNGCKGKTAPRSSSLHCTHISGYQMCVFAPYQANLLHGLHELQFSSDTELGVSIRSCSKRLSPTRLFLQPISNTNHKSRLPPVLLTKQL